MEAFFAAYGNTIPAWLLTAAAIVYLLDKIAGGKLGEFMGAWLSARTEKQKRKETFARSQDEAIMSILTELIKERSDDADILAKEVGAMSSELAEKLMSVILALENIRNILTAINISQAATLDEMRQQFEKVDKRQTDLEIHVKSQNCSD